MKSALVLFLSLSVAVPTAQSEETKSSWLGRAFSVFQSPAAESVTGNAFANAEELAKALRETLAVAAERALTTLSQKGGFANSKLQSFTGIGVSDFDLDQYVNEKALDGLFAAMAAEEKEIRENPLARSTDLLKKLFGGS